MPAPCEIYQVPVCLNMTFIWGSLHFPVRAFPFFSFLLRYVFKFLKTSSLFTNNSLLISIPIFVISALQYLCFPHGEKRITVSYI